MSAVEEYKKWRLNIHRDPVMEVERADAAIAELEAELTALKARRCRTCQSYRPWTATGSPDFCVCGNEVMDGVMDDEGCNPPHDFCCNRWG